MTAHEQRYASWGMFLEAVRPKGSVPRGELQSRNRNYASTMTHSWEECMDLAERGWVEGAQMVKGMVEVMAQDLPKQAMRRELAYTQAGPGNLDLGRYIQGHPRPYQVWQETLDRDEGQGKVVTLLVNIAVSAAVDTRTIQTKGVLACVLVDELERRGYRVEVVIVAKVVGSGSTISTRVVVKQPQDWLDMDKVAFAVAHPSTLRRLMKSAWEQNSVPVEVKRDVGVGNIYGYPRLYQEQGVLYVPEIDSRVVGNREAQLTWVKGVLGQQGITVEVVR